MIPLLCRGIRASSPASLAIGTPSFSVSIRGLSAVAQRVLLISSLPASPYRQLRQAVLELAARLADDEGDLDRALDAFEVGAERILEAVEGGVGLAILLETADPFLSRGMFLQPCLLYTSRCV